jgi:cardiolipin synthase (CMP-forming)
MTEPPLEASERRVLTIPNLLSLLRLASVPVFIWLFVTDREEAGVVVYAVGAWTDFFDGYIARRTGSITQLGKLLDPLADRAFIVALAIALVATEAMSLWLAAVIVIRDVLVLSLFPALDRRGIQRIPVSFVGKTATALLLLGLTLMAWSETTFPLAGASGDVGLAITAAGAGLYWVAAFLYAREAMGRLNALKNSRVIE